MAISEFRILSKRRIPIGEGLPDRFYQVLVTYSSPGLPPYTLFLREDEATDEEIRKRILASIESRRTELG